MSTLVLSDSSAPDDLVELGRVTGAYGVQGWLRIHPYSAGSNTLLNVKNWWLKAPDPVRGTGASSLARHVHIRSSRVHGSVIVARFADISDRDQAERLKGHTVWASRADFTPLDQDEYYWVDLVGCHLYGDDNGRQVLIGPVTGVMDNGAHGILQVARAVQDADNTLVTQLDKKGRAIEVLVPFVAAHVHTVDLENRQIFTDWAVD